MTVYEILCCFKSPNWYFYQDPLNPKYSYFRAGIERSLPPECEDSYLGRLIQSAIVLNQSWAQITTETFDSFKEASIMFELSQDVAGRRFHQKTEDKIRRFLESNLPAAWIVPLFQAHSIGCYTKTGATTSLNTPRFQETLAKLSTSDFPPLVKWFKEHPGALSITSSYEEHE